MFRTFAWGNSILYSVALRSVFFLLTKRNKVLLLKMYNIEVLLVPHLVDVCPMYRGWPLPLAQIWIKPGGFKCMSSPFLSTIPVCLSVCSMELLLKEVTETFFYFMYASLIQKVIHLYDPRTHQMDREKTKNTCLGLVGASLFPSQMQGEHLFACSVTSPFISDVWRGPGSKWDGQEQQSWIMVWGYGNATPSPAALRPCPPV